MRQFLISAGIKLLVATVLLFGSYYVVNHSDFYYLFIGNILLITGLVFLVEALAFILFAFIKALRKRKRGIISTSRSTFIVIFIADSIIRLTGSMQTYPEEADGRYFSTAKADELDSWYWLYTPNISISNNRKEFLFERTTNSIGLAEKEIKKEKGSKYRILAVGDSFTEGVGTRYEESWVKQMETRWEELNVQTINAGIGGSDPVYEYALYRDKLRAYEPDLVLLTINATDVIDVVGRGGFERFHADGTAGKKAPSWEWIYAANHLFRMIMSAAFNYNSNLIKDANKEESKREAALIIEETLVKFKELTDKEGSELLVILQPTLQDFKEQDLSAFFGQEEELLRFLESSEINYLNTFPEFEKREKTIDDYYYPLDTHFNKKGYALFGNTIYQKIEEFGWLDSLRP